MSYFQSYVSFPPVTTTPRSQMQCARSLMIGLLAIYVIIATKVVTFS